MQRIRAHYVASLFGVLGTLAGCSEAPRTETTTKSVDSANSTSSTESAGPHVLVSVRAGTIVAPDSVSPGWRRVRVDELEGEHIVVVFRMPTATTAATVPAFIAALDTMPATPRPAVAIGGPEVGAHGDVIVHLTPGVYVLACVRRGADGHRHAHAGEAKLLVVASPTAADTMFAAPPASTQTVNMVDFAYIGPDQWTRGAQVLKIENTGKQDHQLRLVKLREGATVSSWMQADDPDTVATAVVGMARVGAGQTAYLPVDLAPGAYIAYCLVADGTTKRPHVDLGMLRAITVP